MEGEGRRRRPLNPNAPPFYPTTFHHNCFRDAAAAYHHRPPAATCSSNRKTNYARQYSSVRTPVPSGPRLTTRSAGGRSKQQLPRRRPPVHACEIIPLKPGDYATTVMIRNIPNNYTRRLLVEFLENHCKHENQKEENTSINPSAFDFVYLPVDFKHGLNAGYAFVNFTSPEAAWKFRTSVKGKGWDLFQSKKIADVTRAKIQGKEALVKNCERMKLCSPSSDYLPVWFDPPRDGSSSSSSTTTGMHVFG